MKCDDCFFSLTSSYDPSPSGVSLSSGSMTDWGCTHPDADKFPDEYVETNGACQCGIPIPKRYCPKHGLHNCWGGCIWCQNEQEAQIEADSVAYWNGIEDSDIYPEEEG
jgi:hypothetical protein